MRVFLHEFITSGALAGQPLPASLLNEGSAMRRAVVLDLLGIDGVEVVATRDSRLAGLNQPGLTELPVSNRDTEATLFRAAWNDFACDSGLVIAPEIGDELQRRVSLAISRSARERIWNSPGLISVASDKWRTYVRLKEAGVPTIETCLGSSRDWHGWERPIAKRRDGAGSQAIRRIDDARLNLSDRWIVQPFLCGRWLSCTVFFYPAGRRSCFPPAEQWIADDGSFAYLGGVMPARCDNDRVQSLAIEAIDALSGDDVAPIGPIGVDLVEDERTGDVLVCEVNPRFTTSYAGARELSETNLLAALVDPAAPAAVWKSGRVEFAAGGSIRVFS